MYLYFDVNGNLKEIVQIPVREGSNRVNTLYIYVEGEVEDGVYKLPSRWTNGKINFALLDSNTNLNPSGSYALTKLTGDNAVQLPYNQNRDLKFFKYGFKYEMWSFTLVSPITAVTGVVSATAYLWEDDDDDDVMDTGEAQLALNTFAFNVEASVGIILDSTITQSQYSYLYNRVVGETVPYIGAVNNVNLGDHNLTAANLFAREDISHYIKIAPDGIRKGTVIGLQTRTYDYTLPNSSGELTTIEVVAWNYVPYTGADKDVNLGDHKISLKRVDLGDYRSLYVDDENNPGKLYLTDMTNDIEIASDSNIVLHADTIKVHNGSTIEGATADSAPYGKYELGNVNNYSIDQYYGYLKLYGFSVSDLKEYNTTFRYDSIRRSIVGETGSYVLTFPNKSGTIATTNDLPSQGVCATFNTSSFTQQIGGNYAISDITVSNFISGSNLLVITWDNCFAICPVPQAGAGRVAAAMWNASGESQVIRLKYELKSDNTLLDISLSGGFTPPSGHTAYVFCYKLFN